ncbi:MAG: zinc-binding dehydrogenase [Thermoleophilia bacterium]|nr:zinc-binding dehydrogenase [Thermoleophilia bacterium]
MKHGNRYGAHRVIEPTAVLPQPAWRVDNAMEIYDNEILIDVDTLNIDAASFTQIEEAEGGDVVKMARHSLGIIKERGKHHNPVTGSGGVLCGTVAAIGPAFERPGVAVGDPVAVLHSLSLTPLRVDEIVSVNKATCQLAVRGQAIVFQTGVYAHMPDDMDGALALAVYDVAGAPAQTAKLARPGQTVFIVGAGGKAGLLCAYEARKRVGITGRIIGIELGDAARRRLERTGLADVIIQGSATDQIFVREAVERATGGEMADVTVNCVNVPDTELSSVLATRDDGTVYFFSMATSFTAAALGAEGVGADTTMIIGNGYTKDHAAIALNTLRESPVLMEVFKEAYATGAGDSQPVGVRASEI